MTTTETKQTTIDEYIAGLVALREHLNSHPALAEAVGVTGVMNVERVLAYASTPEEFATLVRDLMDGAWLGSIEKKADDKWQSVTRHFSPKVCLFVYITRALVCERVQVGVETVEVPDPEVEVPMVTVERPVYEWNCDPILAPQPEPTTPFPFEDAPEPYIDVAL